MKAKIMMWIEGKEKEYGTYDFDTPEQKKNVKELSMKVRDERGCYTYVEIVNNDLEV